MLLTILEFFSALRFGCTISISSQHFSHKWIIVILVCRNSSCLGDPHIQDQAPEVRQMGRITSETFRRSWEYCCQKKVWRTSATFLQETIRKWSPVRIFISFFYWNHQILIVSLSHRILREQWIRAKYEREEFIHVEKQRYARGTMEGFLFKRSKVDDSCKQRRFVLSERDNTLKYYVSNVRWHFLNMFFRVVLWLRLLNFCFL